MLYLIVSVTSLCAGFLLAGSCFRRHLKRNRYQIAHQKEALRTIMYQTHHEGINPICKRIRGITTLALLSMKKSPGCSPDIALYFQMIETEAMNLENDTLNKVKDFEHLQ